MFQITLGDCLAHLPDPKTISLVLTDPPYGVGVQLRNHSKTQATTSILGDHDQNVGQTVLDWAAAHNLPTVAFASPMRPWAGEWRQHLVWSKGPAVGGLGDLKRTWKRTWELIQVARNGPLRRKRDCAVLEYPIVPQDLRTHPTAKPVPLLRYLIEQLTDPGQIVFDPFMGSGSTGVACKLTGRGFVGVELDPTYYEAARSRIDTA